MGSKAESTGPLEIQELLQFPWLAHGFGTRRSPLPDGKLATVHQVHSADVIATEGRCGLLGVGDALISDAPGIRLGIKTADCLPVLLVDPEHRAVAAVHAGWKGAAAHIAAKTVERMTQRFATDPAKLYAALGPRIGPCCFEVGPEVAQQFSYYDSELAEAIHKRHLDLGAINEWQLRQAGVRQIFSMKVCTFCGPDQFYSFRRDREQAGRMMSFVGIAE